MLERRCAVACIYIVPVDRGRIFDDYPDPVLVTCTL